MIVFQLTSTYCPPINGLFAQSLRYVQKIIFGILNICLWLFFSHALILNKNPQLWMDTTKNLHQLLSKMATYFIIFYHWNLSSMKAALPICGQTL